MTEEQFRTGESAEQNQTDANEIGEVNVTGEAGNGEEQGANASTASENEGNGDAVTNQSKMGTGTVAASGSSTSNSEGNGLAASGALGSGVAEDAKRPLRDTSRDIEGLVFVACVNVYKSTEDGAFFLAYDEDKKESSSASNASAVGILASQYLADKAQHALQNIPLKG